MRRDENGRPKERHGACVDLLLTSREERDRMAHDRSAIPVHK